MIKKFRERPITIFALKIEDTTECLMDIRKFLNGRYFNLKLIFSSTGKLESLVIDIERQRPLTVCVGDYLVKGQEGDFRFLLADQISHFEEIPE